MRTREGKIGILGKMTVCSNRSQTDHDDLAIYVSINSMDAVTFEVLETSKIYWH